MTPSSGVGYDVTITRRDYYDGMGVDHDWHVRVKRLSDGMEVIRTFGWRWNARRFGRSRRRIGKEFDRAAVVRAEQFERFTLGWGDA